MAESIELLDLPRDHLSTTSRRMYLRCGRQYWYRYIEGQKMPPDSALVLGVAAHAALAWGFAARVKSDRPTALKRLLGQFEATLPTTLQEMQQLAGAEVERKEGDTNEQLLDDGVKMLTLYDGEIGRKVEPVRVEAESSVPLRTGQAGTFQLLVKVDVRTKGAAIIDIKTTKKRKPESEALWDSQLTAENIAEDAAKRPVQSLELHVIGRQKKGPFLQLLKSKRRTVEQKQELLESFATVATAIRAGIFPKTDNLQQTCSWCGFRKLCRPDYARWLEKNRAEKAEGE